MSSSNPINLFNLDGRYASSSQVDAKIAAQASTDSNQYATQSSVANKAAKGANADITSLTGLTTALSVAQGGTGTTTSTGSGANVLATSPTLITPALGTPSAAVLTNATGLPLTTGVTGTLPLTAGGTGATSVSAARTALGVDASGTQEPTLSVIAWAANTAYVKGQLVLSPAGAITANVTSLLQATSSFTSGASFSASNWIQLSDVGLPVGTVAGTVAAGNDSRLTASAANTTNIAALTLNPTAIQTAAYTASAQDLVLADATSGGFTVTLPTAPADKSLVEVKKLDASTNTVTVSTSSSDSFSVGGTSLALALQGHSVTWRYQSSSSKWITLNNDLPFTAVDARYLTQVNAASAYQPIGILNVAKVAVGDYYLPPASSIFNNWDPGEGQTRAVPVFLPGGTYDKVGFQITNAGSSGALSRPVVYSDANGKPSNLMSDSLPIDGSTSGVKIVTLTTPLVIPASGAQIWSAVITQGSASTRPGYYRIYASATGAAVSSTNLVDFSSTAAMNYNMSNINGSPPSTWTGSSTDRTDSSVRTAFRRSA